MANCCNGNGRYSGTLRGTIQKGPYGIPMIEGVPLVGDISLPSLGLRGIYYDKTENWDRQLDFIGREGGIYIYSDYAIKVDDDGNEQHIPNIKIGDGTTPLIDAPFIATTVAEDIVDAIIDTVAERLSEAITGNVITQLTESNSLVTPEDRSRWDNRITGNIDPENPGNLILSF